jgi:hypothetical protein
LVRLRLDAEQLIALFERFIRFDRHLNHLAPDLRDNLRDGCIESSVVRHRMTHREQDHDAHQQHDPA